MAATARGQRARFLFRTEDGEIDAATWRFHTAWLLAVLVAMTAIWLVLRPYTRHDLHTTAFFAPLTIVAFTYLMIFAAAVLFIAVSWTMLTIKRLRARRLPTVLAVAVPLLALFAASLHALQPQTPDVISIWYVVALDALLALAVIWTAVELGLRTGEPVVIGRRRDT